jgi:hypothetical protein
MEEAQRKITGSAASQKSCSHRSFKRVLGESLRSRKFLCQKKAEASFKVMLYNKFMSA